jgi:hypothetical protein
MNDGRSEHHAQDTPGPNRGANPGANPGARLEELTRSVHSLALEVREYTTVTRRHLSEQDARNRQVGRLLEDLDKRVRTVERDHAVLARRVPERLTDGSEIESDLDGLRAEVGRMRLSLARWTGVGIAGGVICVEVLRLALAQLPGVLG